MLWPRCFCLRALSAVLYSPFPRFFFLKPDGSLNAALNSGHPRFPYFFASQNVGRLKAVMKRAVGS